MEGPGFVMGWEKRGTTEVRPLYGNSGREKLHEEEEREKGGMCWDFEGSVVGSEGEGGGDT